MFFLHLWQFISSCRAGTQCVIDNLHHAVMGAMTLEIVRDRGRRFQSDDQYAAREPRSDCADQRFASA